VACDVSVLLRLTLRRVHVTDETRPQPGDLVIYRRSHSTTVFVVDSAHAEVPRLSCTSFDEAVHFAVRTAERLHVNVWFSETTLTRVYQYRS